MQNQIVETSTVTLHTKLARKLFMGKWQRSYIGLKQYASITNYIYQACLEDDPYADAYIIKCYRALKKTKEEFAEIEAMLDKTIKTVRSINIVLSKSNQPFVFELRFATPLAKIGVTLLEKADYISRQLKALKEFDIPVDKKIKQAYLSYRLQDTFHVALHWKKMGITRKDIFENTEKARLAKEQLGALPTKVLNKEVKFSLFPKPDAHSNDEDKK